MSDKSDSESIWLVTFTARDGADLHALPELTAHRTAEAARRFIAEAAAGLGITTEVDADAETVSATGVRCGRVDGERIGYWVQELRIRD